MGFSVAFGGPMPMPHSAMLAPNDPVDIGLALDLVCRKRGCVQVDQGAFGDRDFHGG